MFAGQTYATAFAYPALCSVMLVCITVFHGKRCYWERKIGEGMMIVMYIASQQVALEHPHDKTSASQESMPLHGVGPQP